MSESALATRLAKKVGKRVAYWERIENMLDKGTPDVAYGAHGHGGWIELKHVHDYPKRMVTPIRFKHYTLDQVKKIELMGVGQDWSWVMVQVADDHYLFHWREARLLQLGQHRTWWEQNSFRWWRRRLDYPQLISII